MTLSDDIRSAYIDIGTEVNIITKGSGEYIDLVPNTQVTKPFIKEFFKEAYFPASTSGESGDILQVIVTGDRYMITSLESDVFENEVVEKGAVLYKCNVSGELYRPSGEVWDSQTYHKTTAWDLISNDVFALQTEKLFGTKLEEDLELGALEIERDELYIPASRGIRVNDRYQPTSGEYYKVVYVKTRRFPGVDVVELTEDTR